MLDIHWLVLAGMFASHSLMPGADETNVMAVVMLGEGSESLLIGLKPRGGPLVTL